MHPIIALLATHPLSALEQHGVYAHRSTVNPRKYSLNYDMIEAKDADLIACACRGLIVRQVHDGEPGSAGEWEVLAQPFSRFFNLGQGSAAQLDWENWDNTHFYEKLDGTLAILYLDPDLNDWCWGTRSVPDADVPCQDGETFAEKFWATYEMHAYADILAQFPKDVGTNLTYCFEYTSPYNQIGPVVYETDDLRLLACFDRETSEEHKVLREHLWNIGIHRPEERVFDNLEQCIAWLSITSGTVTEGFVVEQGPYRIKIKNQNYLVAARIMTNVGSRSGMLEVILNGTDDDVISLLPSIRQQELLDLKANLGQWLAAFDILVVALQAHTTDRKTAAIACQDTVYKNWIGGVLDCWSGRYPNAMAWLVAQRRENTYTPSFIEKLLVSVG